MERYGKKTKKGVSKRSMPSSNPSRQLPAPESNVFYGLEFPKKEDADPFENMSDNYFYVNTQPNTEENENGQSLFAEITEPQSEDKENMTKDLDSVTDDNLDFICNVHPTEIDTIRNLSYLPKINNEIQIVRETSNKVDIVTNYLQNNFQTKEQIIGDCPERLLSMHQSALEMKSNIQTNYTKFNSLSEEAKTLDEAIKEQEAINKKLDDEAAELDAQLEKEENKVNSKLQKNGTQSNAVQQFKEINAGLLDLLPYANFQLEEAKGKIRVYCRVRATLKEEIDKKEPLTKFEYVGDNTLKIYGLVGGLVNKREQVDTFVLDKVFKPEASQQQVFGEVTQLVQTALDGQKVCIFAYGQTGSGKTYTMEGTPNEPGIIPRAVEQIFISKEKLASYGWVFVIEVSVYEIYMEVIKDMLSDAPEEKKGQKDNKHTKMNINPVKEIKESATHVQINSVEQFQTIYNKANHKRATAETLMNERSSRSHLIFQFAIKGKKIDGSEEKNGILNLIDLAGSEKSSKSGAAGARLQEAISINKSLTSLKSVITALLEKANGIPNKDKSVTKHIPYKDSTLTSFLQDYLEGQSKTLMFVNLSPIYASYDESKASLRFAKDVNSCPVNT
ncbi:MAG: hypothetical protein MJ252_09030 [archaeon]|nr:hypothetical protein [archaeon]